MARPFKLITKDFNNYAGELIGVSKDTHISSLSPSLNYGHSYLMEISAGTYGLNMGILELTMPEEGDLEGFGQLIKVELGMIVAGTTLGNVLYVGIVELKDIWDEGTGPQAGSFGFCNWDNAQSGPTAWEKGSGAIKSRFGGAGSPPNYESEDGIILDSQAMYFMNDLVLFDLTPVLSLGGKKSFVIWPMSCGVDPSFAFYTRDEANVTRKPIIRVTYKSFPAEAFIESDDQLKIEPNPNNQAQPKLTWGTISDPTFVAYKLYRNINPITSVAALTPIATITNNAIGEYIDTSALNENQDYYYLLTAEITNHIGDDATKSANVTFIRPDNINGEISETIDVGDQVIVTITTSVWSKRIYVEWGDSVDGYWIEYDEEHTAFLLFHKYSSTGAKVIKVRVESSDGYWSNLDTICTKTVDDIVPTAVLVVRPMEVVDGESARCIGNKSQPVASNALISQYDYRVNGAWQTNKGPVFDFIPTSSQEILLRIFTDTGESFQQSIGEGENITLISGQPTLLEFGRDTTINTRSESRDSDAEVMSIMDGIGEIDLPINIKNRVYSINGMSTRQDFKTDIDKIRLRQETQEYTRILVMDEHEGLEVRLDGRITGYSITQSTETYVTWRFTFRVFSRTEV